MPELPEVETVRRGLAALHGEDGALHQTGGVPDECVERELLAMRGHVVAGPQVQPDPGVPERDEVVA